MRQDIRPNPRCWGSAGRYRIRRGFAVWRWLLSCSWNGGGQVGRSALMTTMCGCVFAESAEYAQDLVELLICPVRCSGREITVVGTRGTALICLRARLAKIWTRGVF